MVHEKHDQMQNFFLKIDNLEILPLILSLVLDLPCGYRITITLANLSTLSLYLLYLDL